MSQHNPDPKALTPAPFAGLESTLSAALYGSGPHTQATAEPELPQISAAHAATWDIDSFELAENHETAQPADPAAADADAELTATEAPPLEPSAHKTPAWGNHVAPLSLIAPTVVPAAQPGVPHQLPIEERFARDFPTLHAAPVDERPGSSSHHSQPQEIQAATGAPQNELTTSAKALERAGDQLSRAAERLQTTAQMQAQAHQARACQTRATPGGGRAIVYR